MKKILLIALLGLVAVPAQAQMDAALGVPLPIKTLPTGTVSVRVVNGTVEKPISGLDVQVIDADGQVKTARTSSEGRARIAGLRAGVEYVVKATVDDEEMVSETFTPPEQGGLAFMLSPVPLEVGGGGDVAPHGEGGEQGGDDLPPIMREPRRISGRARPEQNDPAGKLTVRAVQGKFKKTDAGIVSEFPPGGKIYLVEYNKSGKVRLHTETLDDEGRVSFAGLPRSSSYYAMTVFERTNGITDRVMSQAVSLLPQVGSRMLLAGEARDSDAPAIDDSLQFGDRETAPPAGVVSVHVDASGDQMQLLEQVEQVELYRVGTPEPIATLPATNFSPAADDVMGRAGQLPQTSPGVAAGQLEVIVIRMSARAGVPGMKVSVREAGAKKPDDAKPDDAKPDDAKPDDAKPDDAKPDDAASSSLEQTTAARGVTVFKDLKPGTKYVVAADIHGKVLESPQFEIDPNKPITWAFGVDWPSEVVRTATFEGVSSDPDSIYYTRVMAGQRELMSAPFQLTDTMGASVSIILFPEILFGFHGGGDVDDQRVWFEMRVSIANTGQRPLTFGKDGLRIPLPKGFIGGSVDGAMGTKVKVVPDVGLEWQGTLPPGQRDFNITFAIPVERGTAEFDMALPYGLRSGSLMLGQNPGVVFEGIPASVKPTERQMNGRTFKVFSGLSIAPEQRLVFRMKGLPQPPTWRRWLKLGVGGFVLVLLSWGIFGIFGQRRLAASVSPERRVLERKRERLLDQLVRLEGQNRRNKVTPEQYGKQKGRLMKQLESVFEELGEGT